MNGDNASRALLTVVLWTIVVAGLVAFVLLSIASRGVLPAAAVAFGVAWWLVYRHLQRRGGDP